MKYLIFIFLSGLSAFASSKNTQKNSHVSNIKTVEILNQIDTDYIDIHALSRIGEKEFSLPGLAAKAIAYHPSIERLHYLKKSREHAVTSAKWQYFPTPGISLSQVDTSVNDPNYSGDERVISLSLNQPLWAGGQLDSNLNKSRAELNIAKANIKVEENQLTFKVVGAYGQWYSNYLKQMAYQKSKDEHSLLRDRIQRRIKQGLSSTSDLKLVNSRLSQAKSLLNAAKSRHQSSLLNLSELVGEELQTDDLIKDFVLVSGANEDKEILVNKALLVSPNLKKIEAESMLAKATLDVSRSKFQPRVNLKVERQWGNFNTKDAETENRIFLEVVSEFGAGLSTLSDSKKSQVLYDSSKVSIREEQNKIKERILLDKMLSNSLETQKLLLQTSLIDAENIRNSWYRQFLVGRKQWQDVMNSIREVSQLESQIADVHAEKSLADWRLLFYVYKNDYILAPFNSGIMFAKEESNNIEKLLWTPNANMRVIREKTDQNLAEELLNWVIPESENKTRGDKIIWHTDIEKEASFNPIKSFNSFIDFVKGTDTDIVRKNLEEQDNKMLNKTSVMQQSNNKDKVYFIPQKQHVTKQEEIQNIKQVTQINNKRVDFEKTKTVFSQINSKSLIGKSIPKDKQIKSTNNTGKAIWKNHSYPSKKVNHNQQDRKIIKNVSKNNDMSVINDETLELKPLYNDSKDKQTKKSDSNAKVIWRSYSNFDRISKRFDKKVINNQQKAQSIQNFNENKINFIEKSSKIRTRKVLLRSNSNKELSKDRTIIWR